MEAITVVFLAAFLWFAHAPKTDGYVLDALTKNNVEAEQTERGVVIYLPGISFKSGKYAVTDETHTAINTVVEVLQLNGVRHYLAYFEGHTDRQGSAENNMILGQKRADAIMGTFEDIGLSSKRTVSKSYGETLPIGDDPAENRRVAILLIGK